MGNLSPIYYARGDSLTAQNSAINVTNNGTFPTTTIQFDKGVLGGVMGDDNTLGGDRLLDQNSGLADPDTTVWINGVEYNFIVEIQGTLPVGNGKVPLVLQGEQVTVITIIGYEGGGDQRMFFTLNPVNNTFALFDAIGNGSIPLTAVVTVLDPPSPVCFVKGTMINCGDGDVAVEKLNVGDKVLNVMGELVEIKWVGRRIVSANEMDNNKNFAPIRIKKSALGENTPSADLLVSQQHRMLLDNWQLDLMFDEKEALTAAKHMVNDHSILVEKPTDSVEYIHIMFDNHQIIYANGAPSESFHPGEWAVNSLEEAVRNEIYLLFPELEQDNTAYGPPARRVLKSYEARAILNA